MIDRECRFGVTALMAEDILFRRHTLGISYFTVFERDLNALAPAIALLSGR